jgi:predicted small lipoprotein YifL
VPRLALLVLAVALAGCGSRPASELPPAAATVTPGATVTAAGRTFAITADGLRAGDQELATGVEPAALATVDDGRTVASLAVRGRVLELFDARTLRRTGRADAGVGPYGLASDGGNYLYVTDVKLGAVLVFRARPELQLIRRLALPGGPTEIVYDRERRRILVTLSGTGETAELRVGARIDVLRRFKDGDAPGR